MKMNQLLGSTMRFRFTDISMRTGNAGSPFLQTPSGVASGELSFRDCQLRGCQLFLAPSGSLSALTVALNNNLVEYSALNFTKGADVPMNVSVYNNLFRGVAGSGDATFAIS